MPKIRKFIEISQIKMDKWPHNKKTLELVDFLRNAAKDIPPIKVVQLANGNFRIRDGRHRLLAFKLLGKTRIEATYGDTLGFLRWVKWKDYGTRKRENIEKFLELT